MCVSICYKSTLSARSLRLVTLRNESVDVITREHPGHDGRFSLKILAKYGN